MVHFFPLPYPDETLYSVIARYKIWNGNTNSKDVLRELYGKETIVASKHLPSNIKELREHIPEQYNLSEDDLINRTTLYRYYLAFSNNERANIVYNQMIKSEGAKIFATLGLSNNSINNSNSLKLCRKCFEEDKEKYGEAYWHREHQLAGVIICGKHKISLYEIDNKNIRNRQEFININHNDLPEKILVNIINEDIIKKQLSLIRNFKLILNQIYEHKNMNFFRDYYVKRLIEVGISDGKYKINQDILHNRFQEYYGKSYLKLIGCNFEFGDNRSWLTKITRKHRTFFHPLYHLLLIDFLNIDIDELFNYSDLNTCNSDKKTTNKTNKEKEVNRKRWGKLVSDNPKKSKTSLREIDRSIYCWLYRYDREWLDENSPKRNRHEGIKNIDWNQRDEELLVMIKKTVNEILNSKDKPKRVTIGIIGKKLGKEYLLQKQLKKMPKCKSYLDEHLESLEGFQERRISWVKENCFKDEIMTEWKIREKAGLRF